MVVKINKKPIKIKDESMEDKDFNYVYVGVCGVGTFLLLGLLDYICYLFFYVHPFPFTKFLGVIFGV